MGRDRGGQAQGSAQVAGDRGAGVALRETQRGGARREGVQPDL